MKNFIKLLFIATGLFCISAGLRSQSSVVVVPGNADWVDTGFDFDGTQQGFVFASGYVLRHSYPSMSFDNYATPAEGQLSGKRFDQPGSEDKEAGVAMRRWFICFTSVSRKNNFNPNRGLILN